MCTIKVPNPANKFSVLNPFYENKLLFFIHLNNIFFEVQLKKQVYN